MALIVPVLNGGYLLFRLGKTYGGFDFWLMYIQLIATCSPVVPKQHLCSHSSRIMTEMDDKLIIYWSFRKSFSPLSAPLLI